jgi:hypothetical protein
MSFKAAALSFLFKGNGRVRAGNEENLEVGRIEKPVLSGNQALKTTAAIPGFSGMAAVEGRWATWA